LCKISASLKTSFRSLRRKESIIISGNKNIHYKLSYIYNTHYHAHKIN
jgi:hypothetical protein